MSPIPDVPKKERKAANCGVPVISCPGVLCPCEIWVEPPEKLKARAEKIIAELRERAEKAERERDEALNKSCPGEANCGSVCLAETQRDAMREALVAEVSRDAEHWCGGSLALDKDGPCKHLCHHEPSCRLLVEAELDAIHATAPPAEEDEEAGHDPFD